MKKVYYYITFMVLCIILSLSGCTPGKNANDSIYSSGNITSLQQVSIDTLTPYQLDSLIFADSLPEYKKWNKTYLKDGETGKGMEFGVIYDSKAQMIYTVKYTKDAAIYIVQKRRTKSK